MRPIKFQVAIFLELDVENKKTEDVFIGIMNCQSVGSDVDVTVDYQDFIDLVKSKFPDFEHDSEGSFYKKDSEDTLTLRGYVYDWEGEVLGFDTDKIRQFTGLLDKNGKEIYEGDIVKGLHGYDEEGFQIVYNYVSFRFKRANGWFLDMPPQGRDFEIIGNIYENPELLTPQ